MTMLTYKLPQRFVQDWYECGSWSDVTPDDVDAPYLGASSSAGQVVVLNEAQLYDLIDRANYYASFDGADFVENRGLCLSARALAKRFTKEDLSTLRPAYLRACGEVGLCFE